MQHRATTDFWRQYHTLSQEVRARADKQFAVAESKFAASFITIQENRGAPRPGNVVRPHHPEPSRSCDQTDGWIFMVLDWRSQGLRSADFLAPLSPEKDLRLPQERF